MHILFFGPLGTTIHGQTVAFDKATEIKCSKKTIISSSGNSTLIFNKIFYSFLLILKIFTHLVLEKKPDIIYFTCSRSILGSFKDVFLIQLASFLNIPLVNHCHGADFKNFYDNSPYFYKKIIHNSYRKVSNSIVLIEEMKKEFEMFPEMKISVVSNFYSRDLTESLGNSINISNKFSIIYLSNIMNSKGIFLLMDAFSELEKKYKNINLSIAGEILGDDELNLISTKEKFFKVLSKMKNTEYLGVLKGKEKKEFLQNGSVLVLPSHFKSEAVPICIIEAMVSGCAIITTDHNYLSHLVESSNGFVISKKNKEELIIALEKYITQPQILENHQMNNIKSTIDKFSEERYKIDIEKILYSAKNE